MPDLANLVRQALPDGIGLGLPVWGDAPWPGEVLPQAVPARLAEFHQGRSAARAALRAAGLTATALPMNPDRSPRWPQDVTGSISHCAGACMAIAGRAADWAGMGIDLEPDLALDPVLWPSILSDAEVAQLPAIDPGRAVLRIFVAKEAAYKAQYATSRQLIEFQDLFANFVTPDRIDLRFTRAVEPFPIDHSLTVRLFACSGLIAGLCLRSASLTGG